MLSFLPAAVKFTALISEAQSVIARIYKTLVMETSTGKSTFHSSKVQFCTQKNWKLEEFRNSEVPKRRCAVRSSGRRKSDGGFFVPLGRDCGKLGPSRKFPTMWHRHN
jgi:hypothetical protein